MTNSNLIETLTKSPVESEEFSKAIEMYEWMTEYFDSLDDDTCELADQAYVELCDRFGDDVAELASLAALIGHCRVFEIFRAHTEAVFVSGFKALHLPLTNHGREHMKACCSCRRAIEKSAAFEEMLRGIKKPKRVIV